MAGNDFIDTGLRLNRSELDAPTPDSKPDTHITPMPSVQDNSSEPKDKNGNGLEKNGQKRIQMTPIDVTDGNSKKPRINTSENTNAKDGKADRDVTDCYKEGDEHSDNEEFYLTVNNLPTDWTYLQIKDYLDQVVSFVSFSFVS